MESQLASTVMMIRPVRFESNPQTAESNRFQGRTQASAAEQQQAARAEFDGLVAALRKQGIEVLVFDDMPEPHTPDSIFPNNWVSFHADGTEQVELANRHARILLADASPQLVEAGLPHGSGGEGHGGLHLGRA